MTSTSLPPLHGFRSRGIPPFPREHFFDLLTEEGPFGYLRERRRSHHGTGIKELSYVQLDAALLLLLRRRNKDEDPPGER